MEQPLNSLIFVISGFAISILVNLVESQPPDGVIFAVSPPSVTSPPPPPPPPPPSAPPSPPPPSAPPSPPPLPSPPPPPPPSPPSPAPPPPPSPAPPPPPPPPPSPASPPPPSPSPPVPPPRQIPAPRPPYSRRMPGIENSTRNNPDHAVQSLKNGKKVGLFFVGFAAILQVCVVGFLVFKRRQLLAFKERYESCS